MRRSELAITLRTAVLVTVAGFLLFLDHHQRLEPLHWALSYLISPLQSIAVAPTEKLETLSLSSDQSEAILKENAKLRARQLLLQVKLHQLRDLEKENAQLRALLESRPRLSARKVLVASILNIELTPDIREVVIDQGTEAGLSIGQPVVEAGGVLGQTIHVGHDTSRVLLLTDPRHAVPVEDDRSGVRAIAIGDGGNGLLKLLYVPHTADVRVGDLLLTSGLGQVFPSGYPVGTVATVHHSPGDSFSEIWVTPKVKSIRAREVLLIWPTHRLSEE